MFGNKLPISLNALMVWFSVYSWRVQDLGLSFLGVRLRVQTSGLGVQGLEFRV